MAITVDSFKIYHDLENPTLTDTIRLPPDNVIEAKIYIAQSMMRDILGYDEEEELPNNSRVGSATCLLIQYFLENRSTQERVTSINMEDFKEVKTTYYRSNLFKPLLRQVIVMVSKYRKHSKFIPSGELA